MDTNSNSSDNHSPDSANLLPRSIDWAAIHLAYTTSSSSTRDIGRAHGVTHAAIGKRARREGWERPEKEEPVSAKLAKLEPRQQRFVEEYMVDMNATQAAIRAGYSTETAEQIGYQLLQKTSVVEAISKARQAQQERTAITADTVLMEIANVALADARELVEVKTGCCRCCYGEGHKFQRTLLEMNSDRERWLDKGKDPSEFDEQGGIGFNPLLLPNSDCPNCGGDGQARTVLKDTRHLSPRAVALYAGAKQTKEGIEIKMHSKLDALEKLAKHVGLYEKDNTQKNDPLALRNMTDAERAVRMSSLLQANPALVATLAQLMATGAQQ
ncbi:MAG: terminase small subunit [Simplicispira sp.]|uniref:terminase small subunit n=1 Tax=Simplicispira sp. TaxID=2015802 RepID=UPI00258DF504|nr:terminase small subunit [Simplicispira sp.]MDD2690217.1 terminase small subunit [Simplicispira sp.]